MPRTDPKCKSYLNVFLFKAKFVRCNWLQAGQKFQECDNNARRKLAGGGSLASPGRLALGR